MFGRSARAPYNHAIGNHRDTSVAQVGYAPFDGGSPSALHEISRES